MAVNEVKVKTDNKKKIVEDTKELVDQYYKDFKKVGITTQEDVANRKEIDAAALK